MRCEDNAGKEKWKYEYSFVLNRQSLVQCQYLILNRTQNNDLWPIFGTSIMA